MQRVKNFFAHRAKSFRYAVEGILTVVLTQPNMRIIVVSGALAVAAGILLEINYLEWAFVFVAIFFILMAETFNTALEFVVDLVSPEYHPLAKKAKDAAAGAVLVAIGLSLCLASLILLPKFLALFK